MIPKSVTSIGNYTFSGCDYLTNVTFEDNSKLETIQQGVFSELTNLESITFGTNSSLKTIGDSAFYKTGITSIVIPRSVTSIGNNTFSDCDYLTNVTFEDNSSLETIGDYAFADTGITSIVIPNSVTSIENHAFLRSPNKIGALTDVTFEDNSSLKKIGVGAFYNNSITSIVIPNSVISIENYAFFVEFPRIGALTDVSFEENSKLEIIGDQVFANTGITSIVIPSSVKSIGLIAFFECNDLKSVIFEDNSKLEIIGVGAFYNNSITSIEIPSSVTSIGNGAFEDCSLLKTLTMPQTPPETIGDDAFLNTPSIKNIFITDDSGTIIPTTQKHKEAYNAIKANLGTTEMLFGIETDTLTYNFDSIHYGANTAAKTITLTNTFTFDVNLAQPESTNFIVSDLTKTTLTEGESATFTITPKATLGVGTYTEVINVKDENGIVKQIAISVTIIKKPITVSGGSVGVKTYDGTTDAVVIMLTFNGLVNGEKLNVTSDYQLHSSMFSTPNVGESKKVTGTINLVTESEIAKNYEIVSNNYIISTGRIAQKPLEDTMIESIVEQTYTGQKIRALVNVKDGDTNIITKNDYNVSYTNNTNPGFATATITANVDGNYSGSASTTFVINKANASSSIKSINDTVTIGGEDDITIKLPAIKGVQYGTPETSGEIAISKIDINDNKLTYDASTSVLGSEATITIPVKHADNYKPYSITVTITSIKKQSQNIAYADNLLTKNIADSKFINLLTQTIVDGDITYKSDNIDVATVNKTNGEVTIVGIGETKITATASETITHEQAQSSYSLIVSPLDENIVDTDDTSMMLLPIIIIILFGTTGVIFIIIKKTKEE